MPKLNNPNLNEINLNNISDTIWQEWNPIWTKENKTPHDFQEKHSPTKKSKNKKTRHRLLDSRLWNSLSSEQQDAALEITISFENMTKGIGYVTSKFDKIPGSTNFNISELHAELINTYMSWAEKCVRNNVKHAIIVDILCFGFSCNSSDKQRRIRKGSSKQNLIEGLDIYCELKGWLYN